MPKPDYDFMMRLIRQCFNEKGQEHLTFTRWKDSIDVDYPTAAIELFAEAVAAHAYEMAAKLMEGPMFDDDVAADQIRALKTQPLK